MLWKTGLLPLNVEKHWCDSYAWISVKHLTIFLMLAWFLSCLAMELMAYYWNGLISDFLTDRKQWVCVRGSYSSWCNALSHRVVLLLGPVLFIIYVNDLPEVVQSKLSMFADDTKIYCTPMKILFYCRVTCTVLWGSAQCG